MDTAGQTQIEAPDEVTKWTNEHLTKNEAEPNLLLIFISFQRQTQMIKR